MKILVILTLLTLLFIWDKNLSWQSSYTPNHCVAPVLNKIFLPSNLIMASWSQLFDCCECDFRKSTGFVYDTL